MKLRVLILSILAVLTLSCQKTATIPKETMVEIYYDMYLLDQSITRNRYNQLADTLLIYQPIFERYGYTFEDYTSSVNVYLQRPDKFEKIFAEVKKRFESRIRHIEDSLSVADILNISRPIIDSLRALGSNPELTSPYYRALDIMFFSRDTSLLSCYPVPDSAVLSTYKLNAFELYEENPFSTAAIPGRSLVMLPDTSSTPRDTTKTVASDSRNKKKEHTKSGKLRSIKTAEE